MKKKKKPRGSNLGGIVWAKTHQVIPDKKKKEAKRKCRKRVNHDE